MLRFFGFRVLLLTASAAVLHADVRLPALLSDHMVLQRGVPLRFWGNADPGERIQVSFRGVERSVVADANGRWELFLPPQSAGGPDTVQITGRNRIALADVLTGDVWLASGQSNMEWRVRHSKGASEEIAAASHPRIRLFHVPFRVAETPQSDVQASWKICSPESIPDFSAVAYFFGRDLEQRLGMPVGLIEAARGGTPAEAWTGREELHRTPELQFYLTKWARLFAEFPEASKRYEAEVRRWEEGGKLESARPRTPLGPGSSHAPSGLFNGMIAPLTRFAIKGAIWYQGETNATRAESHLYRSLFSALIEGWRDRWNIGRFPFLFVQLANYAGVGTGPGAEWPELREAQRQTLERVPFTGMAVTIDVGDSKNIHPKDKKTVGLRLALAARSVAYGEAVDGSGPTFWMAAPEEQSLRVWFRTAAPLRGRNQQPVRGFAVAGVDHVFEPASARIEGNSIVLANSAVERPVVVRYAWADDPDANLENANGLPASPFRSDDWDHSLMRRVTSESAKPVFGKDGWSAPINPALPNVLILGDSISIGYTREVRHLLQGRANVVRPVESGKDAPENSRSTAIGVENLDRWLGMTRWDAIHFNFGLHDIAYRNPQLKTPGQLDKVNGKVSSTPIQYERNLSEIVARLRRTGACLVWANTTVVPEGEPGRNPGDERTYNKIAERIMRHHTIPVNDLHSLTARFSPGRFIAPGNVHFTAEANWDLAQQVTSAVNAALDRCRSTR
jgi:sialate O-acetylesterase